MDVDVDVGVEVDVPFEGEGARYLKAYVPSLGRCSHLWQSLFNQSFTKPCRLLCILIIVS